MNYYEIFSYIFVRETEQRIVTFLYSFKHFKDITEMLK